MTAGLWMLRRVAREVARAPSGLIVRVVGFAMCMGFLLAGRALVATADASLAPLLGRAQLVVSCRDEVSAARAADVARDLLTWRRVRRATVVSGDEGLRQLRALSAGWPEGATALASVEPAWLPTAIEVQLEESAQSTADLIAASARLRALPEVAAVDIVGAPWGELGAVASSLRRIGRALSVSAAIGAFVTLALLLGVGATARRQAAAAWRAVGGTRAGAVAPSLLLGALIGAVGTVSGAAALIALRSVSEIGLGALPSRELAIAVGAAALLGGLCGAASVWRAGRACVPG